MFSNGLISACVAAATAAGIEPAALLAIVEAETNGEIFERDGVTPQFLYERHVAYREAGKVSDTLLRAFRLAGLAIPKWSKATQYQDERTSQQRLDLMAKAIAIDEETAKRSASWGVGQTMGFLCDDLGFASATRMVAHMTGSAEGQIDCMVREIKHSHLVEALNAHDWRHVARVYNGPGFEANNYDQHLSTAYVRWSRKLATFDANAPVPPEQTLTVPQIRDIQAKLLALGYAEVGLIDGLWGSKLTGAISAFQAHEHIAVSGHYDSETAAVLVRAAPRPVAAERKETSADDLAKAGSRTVTEAKKLTGLARLLQLLGLGGAAGAVSDGTDALHAVKESIGADLTLVSDVATWVKAHWWIAALAIGVVLALYTGRIIRARVEDHRSGKNASPSTVGV